MIDKEKLQEINRLNNILQDVTTGIKELEQSSEEQTVVIDVQRNVYDDQTSWKTDPIPIKYIRDGILEGLRNTSKSLKNDISKLISEIQEPFSNSESDEI